MVLFLSPALLVKCIVNGLDNESMRAVNLLLKLVKMLSPDKITIHILPSQFHSNPFCCVTVTNVKYIVGNR